MYKHFFKRLFDFVGALLIILLLWPLYLIIAILVKVNIGSPVFFKQERVGKGGKTFTMYKFRSMTNATDEMVICCMSLFAIQNLEKLCAQHLLMSCLKFGLY